MTRDRPNTLPLNALMSAPLVEITRAFAANVGQERLSPRHSAEAVLATCSNVFWHLRNGAMNERALREHARVSKRALHFLVDQARRSRWIGLESRSGGSGKRIHLTNAGRAVANDCAQHLAGAERAFRARIGEDRFSPLRPSLEALVGKLDLELPHYPVGYVADLVRHIDDEGIEIRLRPARGASATGEIPAHWAFAGLKRHWFATVDTDESNPRQGLLRLTEKGGQVRDAYQEVASAIERRWQRR